MTWPTWSTVLGTWKAALVFLPLALLAGGVTVGVVYLRSIQARTSQATNERDTARLEAADIAVAKQSTERELQDTAYGQALLKDQVARLKKAVPDSQPTVVIDGHTDPLPPAQPGVKPDDVVLRGSDRPTIETQVQLWETGGQAVGLLGSSQLKLDGKTLYTGAWNRKLSSAEIAKLSPPPGLGVVFNLNAALDLRVGVALSPWRLWGSHQLEVGVLAPPIPVDGRPFKLDLKQTSLTLTAR